MTMANDIVPASPALPALRRQVGVQFQGMDDLLRFCEGICKTDFVPQYYRGKPFACLAAVQYGAEVGLPPMQAINSLYPMNGKIALPSQTEMSLVWPSGLLESYEYGWRDDPKLGRTAWVKMKRRGCPTVFEREFSYQDAKVAGYLSKATYKEHLDAMLVTKAITRCVSLVFPDVVRGIVSEAEASDWPAENGKSRELPSIVEPPKDISGLEEVKPPEREPGDEPNPVDLEQAFSESLLPVASQEDFEKALGYFYERGVGEGKVLDYLGRRTRLDLQPGDLERLREVVRSTRGDHVAVGKVFFGGATT
jgi:hypothetical protein